ncbi:MAG: hypothetical protein MJ211_01405 [Bacteroidales bacterium]|nr:hypothetical protein [Bacteroidales bacterium]
MTVEENHLVALTIIRQHVPRIDYMADLQVIIDKFEIDNVRICECCLKPHVEGFLVDECVHYCCENCLHIMGYNENDENVEWTDYL